MVTMMEALEEQMYSAKRTTLSCMTCFDIEVMVWLAI
jgi:hypothetical protein